MTRRDQMSVSMGLSLASKVMDGLSRMELLAFCMLFITIGYTYVNLAPESPFLHPVIPPYFSMINCVLFAVLFAIMRLMQRRNLKLERLLLAFFLGGMPVIYLWSALLQEDKSGVVVEVAGAFIFMGLAAWGFKRSPLILGLGIVSHGMAWDIWHHNHSVYMENWYSVGCLIIDIALGFLVLTQLKAHQVMGRNE